MLIDSQEQKKLPLGVQRLRLKEHFKTITQDYSLKSTQQASIAVGKNLRDLSKLLPSISGLKAQKLADVNQTVSSVQFGRQRSDGHIKSHSHDIHNVLEAPMKPYTSMSPRSPQYPLPLQAKQPLPRYHNRTTLPLLETVSLPARLNTPQFQVYRRGPPGAAVQKSDTKSQNDEYSDFSVMKNFHPYNFDKDKAKLKELSDQFRLIKSSGQDAHFQLGSRGMHKT